MITPAQTPLYEIKANLFKALAHPARIRILELLAAAPDTSAPVSYLLAETGLEASHLSQHLATLRRHGVVTSVRTANAVTYRLAHPKIAELLAIARVFLLDSLAGSSEQLRLAQELPAGHLGSSGPLGSPGRLGNTDSSESTAP
ncbi:transcriptional regulator, ArsR family [Arthrobacter sp. ok909]|uniref:ArsR/SmtB family transcription factor n=1 Tax=Arthrobacter sp. ok909 TaxID=1761746 RepID=UPI00088AC2D2|nr:metalloregulator ArsR/SmtB family transcription factor [Arthrobacter sp. ok909]SDP35943.1 transcriptional regulator, ArsR family [Arthrobacter sp. ok909]